MVEKTLHVLTTTVCPPPSKKWAILRDMTTCHYFPEDKKKLLFPSFFLSLSLFLSTPTNRALHFERERERRKGDSSSFKKKEGREVDEGRWLMRFMKLCAKRGGGGGGGGGRRVLKKKSTRSSPTPRPSSLGCYIFLPHYTKEEEEKKDN